MRKKRLRYIILSAIAGSVLLTPAMAHNYDSYITNPREPVTYIVDGKANTMQLAKLSESDPYEDYDGKHAFTSTNIEDRFESRGAVTRYTRPNYKDADGAMSVNPMSVQSINHPNDKVTWGPDAGDSNKDAIFNYVALQNGTTENVYVVNHPMGGSGNARLNVLEMFSGDNLNEIAAVNGARNAIQNRVILRNVGRLRDVIGAELSKNEGGSAIDNDVFVAGGRDIDIIYGAKAENGFAPTGSLKNNLVTLGAGKVVAAFGAYATNNNEEDSFFQGKVAPFNNREVIGNVVQLGTNPDDKFQTEGRSPATIGQMVGGFSWTNKANKNTVIIGEGTIDGLGMFKVKNEQSKHSVKGVDANGIYTDEVSYDVGDKSGYKYFRQSGNYYIIGGMSDVEATGNTVDINKAEPFANKQVGIWGGHYILGGSTGDIKSGNTLNVNKVKGITLSHLANFENYNFDLPENAVNGDTILTVTDPHGTDVSNTKINVGVSGAAPVLHNGDSINLIYNRNGVNTTGVQYGKLQQGVSLSYDITAKAGDDKKSVVAVVGKNTSGRPATTSIDEVTTNSLSSYTSYLVNTANSTSQPIRLNAATAYRDANGKMVFTTEDIASRIQSRGEETKYERPENGAGSISVNPIHEFDTDGPKTRVESWGPEFVNARGGNSAKNNYLALQGGASNYLNSEDVFHGTSAEVFTANVDGSGHAIGNVLEMFDSAYNEASGAALVTGSGNAIKNQVVIRTEGMLTGDVVGAALIKSENDDSSNEPTGNAIDNEVLSVGDPKVDALYGAMSINKNAKGILKNNKVILLGGSAIMAAGARASVLDEDETIFQGKHSELRSKEVEGNLVQLGDKLNPKPQSEGKEDPTVGQIVGGFSATNKANKNKVIINDGAIKGIGIFKVKNEQSNHNINGVDANGIYTDEITDGNDNTVYKYYRQPGNYYIIGGMSDVEATGNTVDINKAEPFANKQVGIWGGHYILDGSTGDIKSGNTLNVNKVKGITLSHLANFENYNFDLPENTVNGDSILTVTDPHGTDVSNTKINVGVSGAAPVLHNGDSINLIYNSNGVNTTGVQYGKLQQGVSLSYDITAKAGDDKKSVVAVVKAASEETPTPEKPSTGDTTKPVTPSTGDTTKPVTPSTGDTVKPVVPSTGDTTKPVTPVAPSTGDTTKPVTPVTPSTGDTTKPVTPVAPSTGDTTKPVTPVTPSTGDTAKPVTPVTPSTGDTTKPVPPVAPSTGDTTKPVTPVTPSTGDTAKPVPPVVPSTGDTAKPVTPVAPSTGDTAKPVPPVVPSTGDTTKPVTPSTGNVPVKVLPQTKSLVETRTAVSGFINNGQDSITKAFANHTGETSPIIAGINHDRMKMETGSYANIKGSHVVLGLSKQSGRTYWGPFLEMGWARYDSHLDSGLRAEGNAKYYGVGMYAKTTLDNGVYVESSVRGGRTNYTYESNELVTASSNVHASYDAHNSYYGAHLGLGKVVSYGNQLEGNVYANVFYSHQGEANATLTGKGLGETYAFDSVNSVRTRLGYKVSKHMSNHNTWYLGVAYEREFSGEARATVKGLSTLAPSLGGSSGLVEAGFTYGSNRDAFSATLNVEGWFGQKRGATLGGSINWKY